MITAQRHPKPAGDAAGADLSQVGPAVTPQPLQATSPPASQHFPSPFKLVFDFSAQANTREGALTSPCTQTWRRWLLSLKCPFPFAHSSSANTPLSLCGKPCYLLAYLWGGKLISVQVNECLQERKKRIFQIKFPVA